MAESNPCQLFKGLPQKLVLVARFVRDIFIFQSPCSFTLFVTMTKSQLHIWYVQEHTPQYFLSHLNELDTKVLTIFLVAYLQAHVDLGEQGYCVPRKGTVQVTLFNPLRTVIKMFVVQFNLENMPSNSQTFMRQRTYFMPLGESDSHPNAQKWLRYLIHLRFASNANGQIFLHTDVRMVIFRKSDADTATGFDMSPHELRSFTYAPQNPNYSSRLSLSSSLSLDAPQQTTSNGTPTITKSTSTSAKVVLKSDVEIKEEEKVSNNNPLVDHDYYEQYDECEYINQSLDEMEGGSESSSTDMQNNQQQQRVSVP
jgi:hypothetical protein